MRSENEKKSPGGFTLVEIVITLAIVGILVVISVTTFGELNERYRVEAETKQMFADLMEARGRAMQRNRVHFVRLNVVVNSYATYDDTFTSPDGNGEFENAADTRIASPVLTHAIATSLPVAGGVASFVFDRNGIASVTGNIRLTSTVQPDYNCISIAPTRIKMGLFSGGACVEK